VRRHLWMQLLIDDLLIVIFELLFIVYHLAKEFQSRTTNSLYSQARNRTMIDIFNSIIVHCFRDICMRK
jgi:hypothetical protein